MTKTILINTEWYDDSREGIPRDVFTIAVALAETAFRRKYDLLFTFASDALIKIPRINTLTTQLIIQLTPHLPHGQIDYIQITAGKRVNGGFEVNLTVVQYD